MKRTKTFQLTIVACLVCSGLIACSQEEPSLESRTAFAKCLADTGWVVYGSITCSACRAQRKAFGEAFEEIKEIECNPNAPETQVELCLAKNIGPTPTWIKEGDGVEVKRIEGYQLLEDLSQKTGCTLD